MKKYLLVQIVDNEFNVFVSNEKIGLNLILSDKDALIYELLHNNIAYLIARKIISHLIKYYKNIKFIDAIFYKAKFIDNEIAKNSIELIGFIEIEVEKESIINKMIMSFISYINVVPTILKIILLVLLLLGSNIIKILSLMIIFLILSLLYSVHIIKGNIELET